MPTDCVIPFWRFLVVYIWSSFFQLTVESREEKNTIFKSWANSENGNTFTKLTMFFTEDHFDRKQLSFCELACNNIIFSQPDKITCFNSQLKQSRPNVNHLSQLTVTDVILSNWKLKLQNIFLGISLIWYLKLSVQEIGWLQNRKQCNKCKEEERLEEAHKSQARSMLEISNNFLILFLFWPKAVLQPFWYIGKSTCQSFHFKSVSTAGWQMV